MKKIILLITIYCLFGCTRKLDLKPDSALTIPKTTEDLERLLENTEVMNTTSALAQMSADEYYVRSYQLWESLYDAIHRNVYVWKPDIFEGNTKIVDWTLPYSQIFYCNSVLDALSRQNIDNDSNKKRLKGWALFARAYTFYSLVSTYSKAYDAKSASTDLGIPLKLNANINEIVQRSSVQQSYDQIVKDVLEASELLQQDIVSDKRNRPSKVAAYALLARVFISMRKYDEAEIYVDKSMALYAKLIDFNELTLNSGTFFTYNSEETIYFSQQTPSYSDLTYSSGETYGIDTLLMESYSPSDLRRSVYFTLNEDGNYTNRAINSAMVYPFTGLATDEMYLIKAECLARRNQKDEGLSFLNTLLKTRIETGKFEEVSAIDANEALEKILLERRKALVWRSIRWTDLKRLNLEGRNITLIRKLGDEQFMLEPNSPMYVLPIPEDEIALSGITQNKR